MGLKEPVCDICGNNIKHQDCKDTHCPYNLNYHSISRKMEKALRLVKK